MSSLLQNFFSSIIGKKFKKHKSSSSSSSWCSNKFRAAGVRNEIAISIHSGLLVWAKGISTCGAWPHLKIFKCEIALTLQNAEREAADKDTKHIKCVTLNHISEKSHFMDVIEHGITPVKEISNELTCFVRHFVTCRAYTELYFIPLQSFLL